MMSRVSDSRHNSHVVARRTGYGLCLLLCIASAAYSVPAQDEQSETPTVDPAIAKSSDLSSAFPPGEWVRVERSIDIGLEWLSSQQMDDGRFRSLPNAQPAVTSLAIMAYLARGHVPGHGRYGPMLTRAIQFVLGTQKRRGYFSLMRVAPGGGAHNPGQTLPYNHAIAGLMLGEVYGMTSGAQSRGIEEAIGKALVFSRKMQLRKKGHPDDIGGFRYAYPENPASSDLSVSGWALMFYRSARNAEFEVPKQYFDEGLDFVERCYWETPDNLDKGIFLYRPLAAADGVAKPSLANTGSAMLTLILGGRHRTDMVKTGTEWFTSRDYPSPLRAGNFYLATYYCSQAMAQVSGDTWNQMYPQIATNLIQEQDDDGSWKLARGAERNFGPVYATSFAILALTPPYQLLPIYQR